MFIDKVTINIRSGKGGDGAVSFQREKYIPNGRPDGGDGGKGGDIVFKADKALNNLVAFKYKRKYFAEDGQNGSAKRCTGRDADGMVIYVPIGTVLFNADTGEFLCDMTEHNQKYVAAKGGRGGNGNQHYATSTRQAPMFAKPGDDAIEMQILLELKTIADVGLVGFPNVGKSTFLSVVTNAKPKIANYHFTTLSPNLGMVQYKDAQDFIIADIPGLIEGANEGLGLGHDFLRHVERTRLLVHVIDVSGVEGRDPKEDFDVINNEMFSYSEKLQLRPQIVALNKVDILGDREKAEEVKQYFENKGYPTFIMSAATGQGTQELLDRIISELAEITVEPLLFEEEDFVINAPIVKEDFVITRDSKGVFFVEGDMIRRLLMTVNLDDYQSNVYFQKVLKNKGVFEELENRGVKDGDTVNLMGYEFEYYE